MMGNPPSIRDEDITVKLPPNGDSVYSAAICLNAELSRVIAHVLNSKILVYVDYIGGISNTSSCIRFWQRTGQDLFDLYAVCVEEHDWTGFKTRNFISAHAEKSGRWDVARCSQLAPFLSPGGPLFVFGMLL
jgi:hypothetical protein